MLIRGIIENSRILERKIEFINNLSLIKNWIKHLELLSSVYFLFKKLNYKVLNKEFWIFSEFLKFY